MSTVNARVEPLTLPTYPVGTPEKNPVFFEKRVYQGSCGKVYPVPFVDKVYDEARPVAYSSAVLENEFVKLVMLPEIGGRILIGQDKTNKNYDFFYRQDVIKPALVGLAGPWISGGVEFNWPQHHRPGTFMPADVFIEEEADGARTVWLSEHDPLNRLKGMHGLRLRPGSSLIELRARLFNRTPQKQTFLWWANVAARVHEQYQSFFPPDVHYVADHAVRAMSSFPLANNPYYGVAYQERQGANDLSWYKNIPVPTSYMICETSFDFFGGYDHGAQGGFLHVADRHVAPGKKQWTWGNHPFGWAWDRELTDNGGPYIELMAGVYTDNQPDFSYLLPGETKTFSQFWWPIQKIGPVQNANTEAAIRLVVREDKRIDMGVVVSRPFKGLKLLLKQGGRTLRRERLDLQPGEPWLDSSLQFAGDNPADLELLLAGPRGTTLLSYRPLPERERERNRVVATEPPAPKDIASADELYFTGEHLEQYRHPTRSPETYWQEALARDPGDARCNLAVGRRLLRRGEFAEAKNCFEKAVSRLCFRHPNPETGEAHYHLGLSLRYLYEENGDKALLSGAYDAFFKATWDGAWSAAAYYQLACIDAFSGDFRSALSHLDSVLVRNGEHSQARSLKASLLRRGRKTAPARKILAGLLAIDPLDHWARHEEALLSGDYSSFLTLSRNDAQTVLDLVFDYAWAGLWTEALGLLRLHAANPVAAAPVPNPLARTALSAYVLAWLQAKSGDDEAASQSLAEARKQSSDYFFPSRLQEMLVLRWASGRPGSDALAAFGLGNFLYDQKRHEAAISEWEKGRETPNATLFRNLGIAYWNVRNDGASARASYRRALDADPGDARLVMEYDQLRKKLNDPLPERLAFLEDHRSLVLKRDDASVELAALYNLLNRPAEALGTLTSRRFHPWEGGEGSVLRQFTTAHLLLGQAALEKGDGGTALRHFDQALNTPESLGEAYHLHQAKADVNYWTALALRALGREDEARACFDKCIAENGDFSEMAVTNFSPLSYYRGLALRALGRDADAQKLFDELRLHGLSKIGVPAKIDYFATSLPNLLVFEENLQARRDAEARLLAALGCAGLGRCSEARTLLDQIASFTNCDQRAADLARSLANNLS